MGLLLIVLAGCGGGNSGPSTPISYSYAELGTPLSQATNMDAYALNNKGDVVGQAYYGGSLTPIGFLYSSGTLKDITSQTGVLFQSPEGINDSGKILGQGVYTNNMGGTRAFLYSNGLLTDLDPLASPAHFVAAINNAGQIAGSNGMHAALYSNGAWQDLGAPTGSTVLSAAAINNKGDVAGTFTAADFSTHIFLYRNGTIQDIGVPPNAISPQVVGISDSDQVVGNTRVQLPPRPRPGRFFGTNPFIWDPVHGMQSLPVLTSAANTSVLAVNHTGDILGSSSDSTFVTHFLVWHNGQPTDITALIGFPPGVIGGDGVVNVSAINDRGQIAGEALTEVPVAHLFLLTPHY